MNRKQFIKNTTLGCLGFTALSGVTSCSTIAIYNTEVVGNNISIPLTIMNDKQVLKLKSKALEYTILLIKKPDGNFYSIYMKCTHQDTAVFYDGKNFQCPMHGSSFDKSGTVTNGPATQALNKLETTVENAIIKIHLT